MIQPILEIIGDSWTLQQNMNGKTKMVKHLNKKEKNQLKHGIPREFLHMKGRSQRGHAYVSLLHSMFHNRL